MSAILGSSKFIRCFTNVSCSFLNNTKSGRDINLIPVARSLGAGLSRWPYSTQTESIEPLLQRLDADVRRLGRISRRDLDEVLEEVRHKHAVTSSQSLLVIRCCGNLVPEELPSERTKLVEQIWKTLQNRNVPMDISHYNALLRVYIENEHDFSPVAFLKDIQDKGLEPNRVTYQRLMWRHCQTGDVEGASRILSEMRDKQLPLSGAVLDALVLGHTRQGDAAGARSVLEATRGAGLQPTARTYAILAGGLAAQGDMDAVAQVLLQAEKEELHLSDKDYMDVVEECAVNGREEHMDFFLQKMERGPGYNQDAVNLILRLLNRSKERAALQVLRSMSGHVTDTPSDFRGAFFVRQLVRTSQDAEAVIVVLNDLVAQDLCPGAHTVALDMALQNGQETLALALMRVSLAAGRPVRQHYFWPLYVARGRRNDREGLLKLVAIANAEFRTGPSVDALRDYIVPHLGTDPYRAVDALRKVGVSAGSASRTVILRLLSEGQASVAADLANKYTPHINAEALSGPLNSAFIATGDAISYVTLVRQACRDPPERTERNEDGEKEGAAVPRRVTDVRAIAGRLLLGAVSHPSAPSLPLAEVMEGFLSFGLGISQVSAERIQEKLGSALSPRISELLTKLTAEDLEIVPAEVASIPSLTMGVEQLEQMVEGAEARGDSPLGLKRQLLGAYLRARRMDDVETLLKKLDTEGFILTTGTLASIMDSFLLSGNLERALHYEAALRAKDPDFTLDSIKVVRLADAFLQNDEYEKATDLLQKNTHLQEVKSFAYNTACWKLLDGMAEKGDVDKLQSIFNLLEEKGYLELNNSILGPLIKVHLKKEDTAAALSAFEKCCQKYRCTPWKSELTRKLILSEDAAGLQRLTDLSTLVHGEVNSLYDLVFGFVECGRLRQARRILETPGLRTRNQRFNSVCERYGQEGKVECLEGLLEATKELSHIDRTEVFQQLLVAYTRDGDAQKALGLWTLLQEESLAPTDRFLTHLGEFLQSKDMNVPFVMPEPIATPPAVHTRPESSKSLNSSKSQRTELSLSDSIINMCKAGDLDGALAKKETVSFNDTFSKKCIRVLAESLIKAGRVEEAKDMLFSSMKNVSIIDTDLLQFLCGRLVKEGHVESLHDIGTRLSEEQIREINLDNRICQAYVENGRASEYLDLLLGRIEAATPNDLPSLRTSFPKAGALQMLSTDTSHLVKFENICEKYADRGISQPYNVLWIHHVLDGNKPEADKMWEKFLSIGSDESVLFMKILNVAQAKADPELLTTLLGYVTSCNRLNPRALALIFSRQIDIYAIKEDIEGGYNAIEKALATDVTMDILHTKTLENLKRAVEASGATFKYRIPAKPVSKETLQRSEE